MIFYNIRVFHALIAVVIEVNGFKSSTYLTSQNPVLWNRLKQRDSKSFYRRPIYFDSIKRYSNRKVRFAASTGSDEKEPEVVVQIEDLSLSQISELIEISFIQACMQLAQGYVDVLKLFIVSVKAAYLRITSYDNMKTIVHKVDTCLVNTAGRPLEPEEQLLRSTWIYAVALMLDHVKYKKEIITMNEKKSGQGTYDKLDAIASQVETNYKPVLSKIVELKNSGSTIKPKEFMEQNKALFKAELFDDDIQAAITTQTIKLLWYTLVVIDEERLANDTSTINEMPDASRPYIPRGEGFN